MALFLRIGMWLWGQSMEGFGSRKCTYWGRRIRHVDRHRLASSVYVYKLVILAVRDIVIFCLMTFSPVLVLSLLNLWHRHVLVIHRPVMQHSRLAVLDAASRLSTVEHPKKSNLDHDSNSHHDKCEQ